MSRTVFFPLIESIEVVCGIPQRVELHQERMRRSGSRHGFRPPALTEILSAIEKEMSSHDLRDQASVRCTIEYDTSIRAIQSLIYKIRDVRSLLIVEPQSRIDYSDKWADRTCFASLSLLCKEHQEPLIVQDTLLTDTTYSNIVIEKQGKYLTPTRPLLMGTRRQHYLDQGIIQTADITVEECLVADHIHLVNAMMPLGALTISPKQVFWDKPNL